MTTAALYTEVRLAALEEEEVGVGNGKDEQNLVVSEHWSWEEALDEKYS